MPFLRIGPVDVDFTEFRKLEPVRAGVSSRAASNNLRSTLRPASARRWSGKVRPMTPQAMQALIAAIPDGSVQLCWGTGILAAAANPVACEVLHGEAPFTWQPIADGEYVQELSLVLAEATGAAAAAVYEAPASNPPVVYVPPTVTISTSVAISPASAVLTYPAP
jgi:hypothetical protein